MTTPPRLVTVYLAGEHPEVRVWLVGRGWVAQVECRDEQIATELARDLRYYCGQKDVDRAWEGIKRRVEAVGKAG